jgi:hypothetical protein
MSGRVYGHVLGGHGELVLTGHVRHGIDMASIPRGT